MKIDKACRRDSKITKRRKKIRTKDLVINKSKERQKSKRIKKARKEKEDFIARLLETQE